MKKGNGQSYGENKKRASRKKACKIHVFKKNFKICYNSQIAISVLKNNKHLGICKACWKKLARSNIEWTKKPE